MENFKKFIGQSSRHYIMTGALLPSSKSLAKRMTEKMKGKVVLELGPGTGVFTEEILRKLPKDGLLISIEANKAFVEFLRDKFQDDRLKLYNGDACNMSLYLNENGYKNVDYIVSGLPLGHFSRKVNAKVLSEAKKCLSKDGIFVQFEYFLAGYKSIKKAFPKVSISFELFNLPPAFVMKCRK
jgi:phospholipid N-methyltransferase